MSDDNRLDGTWKNSVFKLVIRKNKYVSFFNGFRYGKGTIIYGNENFTLTSTHARSWLFFWFPFVETVKGKYAIADDGVNVLNIEGRYCDLNGIWENGVVSGR